MYVTNILPKYTPGNIDMAVLCKKNWELLRASVILWVNVRKIFCLTLVLVISVYDFCARSTKNFYEPIKFVGDFT